MMPRRIEQATVVHAAGRKPKRIEEYAGRVNSGHTEVVLRGDCRSSKRPVSSTSGLGQAVVTSLGEWVRYSTPDADGAEYVAVCLPAFTPANVHRDA
jgi:hypothetical protein